MQFDWSIAVQDQTISHGIFKMSAKNKVCELTVTQVIRRKQQT